MERIMSIDRFAALLAIVSVIVFPILLINSSLKGRIHLTRDVPVSEKGFLGIVRTRYASTVLSLMLSATTLGVVNIFVRTASIWPVWLDRFFLPAMILLMIALYWYASFFPLFNLYTNIRSASPISKPLGLLIGERLALGSTFTRDPLDHTASIIQRIKFDYVLLNEYQLQKLGERAPTPSFVVYDESDPAATPALQALPLLVRSFPVELSDAPAARDVDAVLSIHGTSIGINHAILAAISDFGTYPEDLSASGNATIGQLVRTVFTVENPSQKLMVALNVYEVLLKQTTFLCLARQGTSKISAIAEHFSDPLRGTLLDSPRTWLRILRILSTDDGMMQEMLEQEVEPARWSDAVFPIVEYLKLDSFEDHTFETFFDLLELIVFFRNKTRGHGIIRDQTALLVLPMFMNVLILMLRMSGLERLSTAIDPDDGSVAFSSPDGLWPAGDLVVYDETIGDFAYLSEIRKNGVKMIAYIAGEYVVPSRRTLNVQREGHNTGTPRE
jgi:hypothetical protein